MPITPEQSAHAENQQIIAARCSSQYARLVAGPGTGKSHTIERRVGFLLQEGAAPESIYAISFTRAACSDLHGRIVEHCHSIGLSGVGYEIKVSTMHSLALKILRRGSLLVAYPSTPIILDTWEQRAIYDKELSIQLACTVPRAREIRFAYEAHWQTLDSDYINQAVISEVEQRRYRPYHSSRTNLYCCVLPGEVIFKCVEAFNNGTLNSSNVPSISHLIVDEYQDLNACDQEFIRLLISTSGASLFVAGDDDQSIYSFRHANPDGIVHFDQTYEGSEIFVLNDCFRCTPSILNAASRVIAFNPNRLEKNLTSLYGESSPPVYGEINSWAFSTPEDEARAIAESCRNLIDCGFEGRENEILILISNRRIQLDILREALRVAGVPHAAPSTTTLVNEDDGLRAIYDILRILRNIRNDTPDYPAHRDLLGLLAGVGDSTVYGIADACISNNQNYHDLFYIDTLPVWLNVRQSGAMRRVRNIIENIRAWLLEDTLEERGEGIANVLSDIVFSASRNIDDKLEVWNSLVSFLPNQMNLDELYAFLNADNEQAQQAVLNGVGVRVGTEVSMGPEGNAGRVRILTMHGAKGLSGNVVFIPSAEQGIMPNINSLRATGLVIEQRRLFYVSVTRARVCCIVSHVSERTGPTAQMLVQRSRASLHRSQFLDEMGIPSVHRVTGLNTEEAGSIVEEANHL